MASVTEHSCLPPARGTAAAHHAPCVSHTIKTCGLCLWVKLEHRAAAADHVAPISVQQARPLSHQLPASACSPSWGPPEDGAAAAGNAAYQAGRRACTTQESVLLGCCKKSLCATQTRLQFITSDAPASLKVLQVGISCGALQTVSLCTGCFLC